MLSPHLQRGLEGQRASLFKRLLIVIGRSPKPHVYTFSYCLITAVVRNICSSFSLLYTAKI